MSQQTLVKTIREQFQAAHHIWLESTMQDVTMTWKDRLI
jgi:hypothetical protein